MGFHSVVQNGFRASCFSLPSVGTVVFGESCLACGLLLVLDGSFKSVLIFKKSLLDTS